MGLTQTVGCAYIATELGMAKNGWHGWQQKREEGEAEAGKGERRKRSRDLGHGRHGKAKSHGRAL